MTAVIPARAGSKRLPGKNARPFAGQPLVVWSVRAALACPLVDGIVVSTDDPRVVSAVEAFPVRIVGRPARLASDRATTRDVLAHVDAALGGAVGGPELMVLLQPTSPLREIGLVEDGVTSLRACPSAARLIEVTNRRLFTGTVADSMWVPDFPDGTRSQDLPPVWFPSGRLYVLRCALTFDGAAAGHETCLAMPARHGRCPNIDDEDDFLWAEAVYRRHAADYDHLREAVNSPT